jgi:hypothetical protein
VGEGRKGRGKNLTTTLNLNFQLMQMKLTDFSSLPDRF